MDDSVSIGGRPYTVARFRSYKAVLVGEILSTVTKEIRGLLKEAAAFRREYRAENALQITRQMCLERISDIEARVAGLREQAADAPEQRDGDDDERATKAELEASARQGEARAQSWRRQLEDMGERTYVEMPQDPTEGELIVAVFPKAFAMRTQLSELLALLVTPDVELLDGWRKDTVRKMLRDKGDSLLAESEPAELVELAIVAKRVVGDQFRPLLPALRTLRGEEPVTEQTAEPTTPATTTPDPTPSPA